MYIQVIHEDSDISSTIDHLVKIFLANIAGTVQYKFANGVQGINQVLICCNTKRLNSTTKFNYGKLGALQFNLTVQGNPIPVNETSKNLAWSNQDTHTLIDIKGNMYEILSVVIDISANDEFKGRVLLRSTKETTVDPNTQVNNFLGAHEYTFEVRDFNDATDSVEVDR